MLSNINTHAPNYVLNIFLNVGLNSFLNLDVARAAQLVAKEWEVVVLYISRLSDFFYLVQCGSTSNIQHKCKKMLFETMI